MKKPKKDSPKVRGLKIMALRLYVSKQITRKLCKLIMEADYSDEAYVKSLTALTEDLLRVQGYYSTDERIAKCDKQIDEWINNRKLSV